jgi:hypothetical protein
VRPDGEHDLSCRVEGDQLVVDVPNLDLYALVVIGGGA